MIFLEMTIPRFKVLEETFADPASELEISSALAIVISCRFWTLTQPFHFAFFTSDHPQVSWAGKPAVIQVILAFPKVILDGGKILRLPMADQTVEHLARMADCHMFIQAF